MSEKNQHSEAQYMDIASPQFGTRRIAWLQRAAAGGAGPGCAGAGRPGLVWLNGFKSEMISTKASALDRWAEEQALGLIRLDYSGHGQSGGDFEKGTIGAWLEESLAVLDARARGPQVLVGSSMGGWIALLIARAMARKAEMAQPGAERGWSLAGLVLIAPAWDMTERLIEQKLTPELRAELEHNGVCYRPSVYEDEPYPITLRLIEEGRAHLIGAAPFDPKAPVRILHGMRDPDVAWKLSVELAGLLTGEDVQLSLVKDGEHRMSRPGDLRLLLSLIAELSLPAPDGHQTGARPDNEQQ